MKAYRKRNIEEEKSAQAAANQEMFPQKTHSIGEETTQSNASSGDQQSVQRSSVQRQNFQRPSVQRQTTKGFSFANVGVQSSPQTTLITQRKVSQQDNVETLEETLQPKQIETRQLTQAANNIVPLKSAAKRPLHTIQRTESEQVIQQDKDDDEKQFQQTFTAEQDGEEDVDDTPSGNDQDKDNDEVNDDVLPEIEGDGYAIDTNDLEPDNWEAEGYIDTNDLVDDEEDDLDNWDPGQVEGYIDTNDIKDDEDDAVKQPESNPDASNVSNQNSQQPQTQGSVGPTPQPLQIIQAPAAPPNVKQFGSFAGAHNPEALENMMKAAAIPYLDPAEGCILYRHKYDSVEIHKSKKDFTVVLKQLDLKYKNTKYRPERALLAYQNKLATEFPNIVHSEKTRKYQYKEKNVTKDQKPKADCHFKIPIMASRTNAPEILQSVGSGLSAAATSDATDVAQEALLEGDAYTIYDRVKLIGKLFKGDGDDVPEKVADMIGNTSSFLTWAGTGLGLMAAINQFSIVRTYTKRRKGLEGALTQCQKDLSSPGHNKDKSNQLTELWKGLEYGIKKMSKRILTALIMGVSSLVQVLSRIFTAFFPQIAIGTIFVDLSASAVKLASLLWRKGKGVWKYVKNTRGKQRLASAQSILSAALSGEPAGIAAIRALSNKTVLAMGAGLLSTGAQKGVKKISKGTTKLNKKVGGQDLSKGLSDQGKKELQYGLWPSNDQDLQKMLKNADKHTQVKQILARRLSNELKSS